MVTLDTLAQAMARRRRRAPQPPPVHTNPASQLVPIDKGYLGDLMVSTNPMHDAVAFQQAQRKHGRIPQPVVSDPEFMYGSKRPPRLRKRRTF